nr:hypothetical protein [uncultured Allomuricauda sp.]
MLQSESINPMASCAYFYSDPTNSTSISPDIRNDILMRIGPTEFWRFVGNGSSTVQN